MGVDFFKVVKQVEDVLGVYLLVMILLIGCEDEFCGVVDVLIQKVIIWDDFGLLENFEVKDIFEDMFDLVVEYCEKMVEIVVEQDDELMEVYLDGNEFFIEDIKCCICKGIINLDFFFIFCGFVFKNKGI